MVLTIDQAYAIMDMLGLVWGQLWYVLDSVQIVTVASHTYSFLDIFLIAAAVMDIFWELIEEMRS